MNQNNFYSPGNPYTTNTGNIKSVNDQLVFEEQIVLDVLPTSTTNTLFLSVDGANQVFKQVPSGGGGGGDVSSSISSCLDNQVAVFDGTTGKLLKNSDMIYGSNALQIPSGGSFVVKNPNGTDFNFQMFSSPSGSSEYICFGFYIKLNPFQFISGSPTGQPVYLLERNFGTFNFKRNSVNPGEGSVLNTNDFFTVWRANNSGFDIEDAFALSFITSNTTNETVLVWDQTNGNVQWRNLSLNPINPFNQSLNTGDSVGFNELTTGTTNSFFMNSASIGSFPPSSTIAISDKVSFNDDITTQAINIDFTNATSITGIPNIFNQSLNTGDNVKFNGVDTTLIFNSTAPNPLIIGSSSGFIAPVDFTTAGTVDFTGASVIGLPTGGDVNSSISSSTNNSIATFDGTTGKLIKEGLATIDGTGKITSDSVDCQNITCQILGNFEDLNCQNFTSNSLNDFDNSTTTFINSSVDFNGATINNFPLTFGDVSSVATSSALGQLAFFDDNTNKVINNSGILVNGANDITNINDIGCQDIFANDISGNNMTATGNVVCSQINTGNGLVECFAMDQPVLNNSNVKFGSLDTQILQNTVTGTLFFSSPAQFFDNITLSAGKNLNISNSSLDLTNTTITGKTFINYTDGTSTNNSIPRYDGTTGDIKNSSVSIDDSAKITASSLFVFDVQANNTVDFRNSTTDFRGATLDFENSTVIRLPAEGLDTTNLTQDDNNRVFITTNAGILEKTEIRPVRGGIFFTDNVLETTINTVNVWEIFNVTIWTPNTPINTGTASSNQIQIIETQPGFFQLTATVSYRGVNTSNNIYQLGIFKNSTLIPCSTQKASTTESTLEYNTTLSCITNYVNSDIFDVRVRNRTDTDNIFITDCSFTLFRICD